MANWNVKERRPAVRRWAAILAGLFLLVSPLAAQGFPHGLQVYDRGDYETVLKRWLSLAKLGDSGNQASIGVSHERDQRFRRGHEAIVQWGWQAVEQEFMGVQLNFWIPHRADRGVPQSYPELARWYQNIVERSAENFINWLRAREFWILLITTIAAIVSLVLIALFICLKNATRFRLEACFSDDRNSYIKNRGKILFRIKNNSHFDIRLARIYVKCKGIREKIDIANFCSGQDLSKIEAESAAVLEADLKEFIDFRNRSPKVFVELETGKNRQLSVFDRRNLTKCLNSCFAEAGIPETAGNDRESRLGRAIKRSNKEREQWSF